MDEPPYLLSRGVHASLRLNLQHQFIKDAIGYLIHPSVPINREEPLKIADIGTGTAIWLLDVARNLSPNAQFDGFDISDDQWPTKENRPANINLRFLDCVNKEVPSELHDAYDIVHVRLFLGVISENDPSTLFTNAWKLLKPGGYLQWTEIDPRRTEVRHPTGGATASCEAIVKMATSVKDQRWIQWLADTFIDAGMDPVKHEFCREQVWQRRSASDSICALGFDMVTILYASDAAKSKEFDQTVGNAAKEVQNGAYFSQALVTVVGRKPAV